MIGTQVTDTAAVAAAIAEATVDDAAWTAFIAEHLGAADGRASERLVERFLGAKPAGPGATGATLPRDVRHE